MAILRNDLSVVACRTDIPYGIISVTGGNLPLLLLIVTGCFVGLFLFAKPICRNSIPTTRDNRCDLTVEGGANPMLNWFRRASRRPCLRHDTPEGFHTLLSNAPDADSPPGCAIAERTALPHVLSQKDAGVDSSGTAVIPEGTEEIARRAFSGMDQLRKVVLPLSVKNLGSHAFANCRSLT